MVGRRRGPSERFALGDAAHRTRVAACAALAVGALLGLAALWPATPTAAALEPAETAVLRRDGNRVVVPAGSSYRSHLVVQAVERRVVERTVSLPAMVEADPARVYNVLPPLGGRILALKVDLGQRVVKGQPLVVVESSDLAQALSDLAKADAQVSLTHRALERARSLAKAGGGSVKDLEGATNDAAQADSELQRARSRLATVSGGALPAPGTPDGTGQAGAGPGGTGQAAQPARTLTVAAQASGTITALSVAAGGYINDPTQSMMTISNLDTVWVTAMVPEADIGAIAVDQPVDLTFVAYPALVVHGKVLFVGPITEPDTRRTKVRVAVPDADGRLKPNMYATARFRAAPTATIAVPDGALLMNNEETSVFVETAPWTFERRDIKTGRDVGDVTVVTQGLDAGERVVVRGGVLLND